MNTFILIHGGLMGGAIWDKIVPKLQSLGQQVFNPDLKGMGQRVGELSKEIGLEDHAEDICQLIEKNKLKNVTLVAHSYGGMPATIAASRCYDRITKLIYLDANVPDNGQCLFDLLDKEIAVANIKTIKESGEGWRLDPLQRINFNDITEEDAAWLKTRLSFSSLKMRADTANYCLENLKKIPIAYIYCKRSGGISELSAAKARQNNWQYYEMPTGHLPMLTEPNQVVEILLKIIEQ